MSLDHRLIKLAKISPKIFAKQILIRNESLLERLRMLKDYVECDTLTIPSDVYNASAKISYLGCPHCGSICILCLWSQAGFQPAEVGYASCRVADFKFEDFEAIALRDMQYADMSISVNYHMRSEEIRVNGHNIITREDYDACEHFLLSHIEWAKLDCRGEEYVEEKVEK